MKKADLKKIKFRCFILFVAAGFLFLSCSEGLFNFSEQTGNISLTFTADSAGININRLVFTLHNQDTDDNISREVYVEHNDVQEAEEYIPRANVGGWSLGVALFDYDNKLIVPEQWDSFELELGQTAIIDVEYNSTGGISFEYEKPAGSEPESSVRIDSLDTFLVGYHQAGAELDTTSFTSFMIARGSGFNTGVTTVRAEYPDGSSMIYDSNWSRSIGNIEVAMGADSMSLQRIGYTSSGPYSLILTDINGVETGASDDFYPGLTPENGLVSIYGTVYGGTDLAPTMWEQNESLSAGCYIVYIITTDGAGLYGAQYGKYPEIISPSGIDSDIESLSINYSGAAGAGASYVVIATVDGYFNNADPTELINAIDYDYFALSSYAFLLPNNFPAWLYTTFGGERISFVGISVAEYSF